jgi:hypothetical protein
VSFLDELCGRTFCSTRRHGHENYRDEEHLSVAGAVALTPEFARLIELRGAAAAQRFIPTG